MKGFWVIILPVLMVLASGRAVGQVFPRPTSTPRPSPTATPEPRPVPCPQVSIQPQAGQMVKDGQAVAFAANIAGGDPRVQPIIMWSINAGVIKQGQNTRRIEVDTTGAGSAMDRELKAELWVSGYAPECVLQATTKIKIIPPAVKFGEFGEVDDATFKRNLEALAKFLAETPDNLHVIGYAGRKSERGFTSNWMRRIREYLVTAGIPARRLIGIDGGFREEPLFDFYIVPMAAEPPRPSPTVNRNEIVYPKTLPGKPPSTQ